MVWVIRILTHLRMEYTAFFVGIFSALIQLQTNKRKPARDAFSRHNGIVLTIFLLLPVYINPILFPIKTPFANEWKDGICLQTTGESCGPACVATILRMHGIETAEEKVSREVFCSERGSEMWMLGRYLEKNGLNVELVHCSSKPFDPPVPSLAGVGLGGKDGISHAIIILDKTKDSFTIVDPQTGRFVWSKDKTWENYYFFGFLMHITKKR